MTPAELLKQLIRFDTTNPPGAERECVQFLADVLAEAGIDSQTYAAVPERPNLIARVKGGERPPIVLQGHVDVVTTAGQRWSRPPFGGEEADGYIWGRGALDMKNGVAMMTSALIRAKADADAGRLPGDVILCALVDEEAGGVQGAAWLCEQHPELFAGARYTIGEGGGYSFEVGGRRFYPLMLTEKRGCQIRVTLRGPGGHGSLPMRGGAVAKTAALLSTLNSTRLPVHVTPVTRMMLEAMRDALQGDFRERYAALLDPHATDAVLDQLGADGRTLDALLHNTVNATIIEGGAKINVIPSEVHVWLDGRLLPGFGPEQMLRELRNVIGKQPEIEVVKVSPAQPEPELSRYPVLAGIIRELDGDGVPIPYLVSGGTDGRHFAQLGLRTYGFTPVRMPPGFDGWSTIHDADERIPVDALEFGTEAIYRALLQI